MIELGARWTVRAALLAVVLASIAGFARAEVGASSVNAVDQRRNVALDATIAAGRGNSRCGGISDSRRQCGALRALGFALAALYRGKSDSGGGVANAAIQDVTGGLLKTLAAGPAPGVSARARTLFPDRFYVPLELLTRTYFMFGPTGTIRAKALTDKTQQQILALLSGFAKAQCRLADADAGRVWHMRDSENHDVLHTADCLAAGEILSAEGTCPHCKYDDGSTPQQQRAAWSNYLAAFIRSRAKYGGLVEFFSPTYYKYTLSGIYDAADFASDPELRQLARAMLDVWFADWAEEQINGIHGGSKARVYFQYIDSERVGSELGWLYFGLGTMQPSNRSPALIAITTSSYRPPALVAELATDVAGRGTYVVRSRRPGLRTHTNLDSSYHLEAQAGGVLSYAYVDPSFVMGTSMVARLPARSWAPPSAANRWNGMILAGGADRYIFATPVRSKPNGEPANVFNAVWGVQSKGTQILQRLPPPFGLGANNMAVWIGPGLRVEGDGEWMFVNSSAFVAFRPAFGGFKSNRQASGKFFLNDSLSPVILQVAPRSAFHSFADFKTAVMRAPLDVTDDTVRFRGLDGAGLITFHTRSGELPDVDGKPIDLQPDFAFDSPFLQEKWGSGKITIKKGGETLVRDFR